MGSYVSGFLPFFWEMLVNTQASVNVTASFEYSMMLELVISELKQKGIPEGQICAIPLNVPQKEKALMDTIHRADGLGTMDLATFFGTVFMLFGMMWGFMWTWGPVIWGTIGLFGGGFLGFAFKYIYYRLYAEKQPSTGKNTEVVLIVACQKSEAEWWSGCWPGTWPRALGGRNKRSSCRRIQFSQR